MKKFLTAFALFGVALCGRLDKDYLPPFQGVQANSALSNPQQQPQAQAPNPSFQHQASAQQYQNQPSGQQYQSQQSGQQYQNQQYQNQPSAQQYNQQYQNQPSGQQYQNEFAGQAVHQAAQAVGPSGPINKEANDVPILRLENNNDGETYSYALETGNGIVAHQEGDSRGEGIKAQGGYTYTAPDGQVVSIQYTADENGYQAQGSHLPVAPAIPEEIQKAVEQNLADEARGIFDDGQYREESNPGQQYLHAHGAGQIQQYSGQSQQQPGQYSGQQQPAQNQQYSGQSQQQPGQYSGQQQPAQNQQYSGQSQQQQPGQYSGQTQHQSAQNQQYSGQSQQQPAQSQQYSSASGPGQQYQSTSGAPAQSNQYPASQANAGGYKY